MDGQPQSQQRSGTQAQNPAHRDMMFCHECQDEWYRDEHGLTCPECGSDFTEIIEENNDPRGPHHGREDSGDDGDSSMPDLEEATGHPHPLLLHRPWRNNDDPDEADISRLQFRSVGPGRFTVTGTVYRTVSPADIRRGGEAPGGLAGGFASMLTNMLAGPRGPQQQGQGQPPNQGQGAQEGEERGRPHRASGVTPEGNRWSYSREAHIYHRNDPNNPQSGVRVEPFDELNNVLVGLMAAFGEPPGQEHRHHYHPHIHMAGNEDVRGMPFNPMMALLTSMIGGGGGAVGDAVYSQEAMDRIISQLMEQNATSNAPGPASQKDIDTLPRKKVSEDMLGSEGRAECSICMDEVHLGEEVTELPCHHWFHHPCISAWLSEHDTCPHCRKGITKKAENGGGTPVAQQSSGVRAGSSPSSGQAFNASHRMPGAFEVAGEGTAGQPYVVAESAERAQNRGPNSNQQPRAADEQGSGGLGERLRRGLFGSPR